MFWGLDRYLLRQERLFRKTHNHVRMAEGDSVDFSMNTQPFEEVADGREGGLISHAQAVTVFSLARSS